MTEQQFKAWCNEVGKLLPDTFAWMNRNQATVAYWFDEIFKDLDYDVCMSVARQLWMEGVAAFDRERIPGMVVKRHGEILHSRRERYHKAQERRRMDEGDGSFYGDPIMRHAMSEAAKLNHNPARRAAFVDQLIEKESEAIQTAEEFEQQCQW